MVDNFFGTTYVLFPFFHPRLVRPICHFEISEHEVKCHKIIIHLTSAVKRLYS